MNVLILCSGNTCRSQMAQGFLQAFDSKLKVYSAGTNPEKTVNPYAVAVMQEMGISIDKNTPEAVEDYLYIDFQYVITVCDDAEKNCPVFQGNVKKRLHIGFDDPAKATGSKEQIRNEFRRIRNEILVAFFKLYHTELRNDIIR